MNRDVFEYVTACPTKTSNKPAAGLLTPLPTPCHPWSHISLDFASGLTVSDGHTAVLTIVDRFYKMVHFVPMPKLPSAKKTAEVILQHVVRLHGFPADMVSDRGPHFFSQLRRAFCSLVGASVSLFSGFHPLSNVTEWLNQELEMGLRFFMAWTPAQWSRQLLWIEFCVHRFFPLSVHLWA